VRRRGERHELEPTLVHVAPDAVLELCPEPHDVRPVTERARVVRHVAEVRLLTVVHRAHFCIDVAVVDRVDEGHGFLRFRQQQGRCLVRVGAQER
jgi:hypothetical protein